jgi:hypothetical protein
MKMAERDRFMQEILDREWEMFQQVKSAAPAVCQNSPDTFRKVRGSIFQLWPRELMAAYLIELTKAKRTGRNLITAKYARMDNLIPPLNTNPVIDKIVEIEAEWQEEIRRKYPALYQRTCRSTDPTDDGSNFSIYLKCELETYGDTALDLYYQWINEAKQFGMNYSLTMLNHLALNSGFKSIDEAEQYWAGNLSTGGTGS